MLSERRRLIIHRCLSLINFSLITVFAGGCDEAKSRLDKLYYDGTHIGVQRCIENAKNEIVELETIKRVCIRQNEKNLSANVDGTLSFSMVQGVLEVNACNLSADVIVTRLFLKIRYGNNETNVDTSDTEKLGKSLWIEPKKCVSLYIQDLSPKPNSADVQEQKPYFQWSVESTYGIRIYVE